MRKLATLALIALLAGLQPGAAQQRSARPPAAEPPAPPAQGPAAPEPPPPPYEPPLLELAEILGALSFLSDLCHDPAQSVTAPSGEMWRQNMRDLIDVEATTTGQKERLAGAFNRGLTGYQATHRHCTDAGRLARDRLMDEGARLARDISSRYGS